VGDKMMKMMMATIIKLLKQIFNKVDGRARTGFLWLRIWARDWILLKRKQIFGFRAMRRGGGLVNFLTS
jgi:hypothetical protein